MIKIPEDVKIILDKLKSFGFEAYVVGGCVRDAVIGRTPGDWDICTNALPHQTQKVFEGFEVVPTGLKHGTVMVVQNGEGYEITTYRIDGSYSDGRHPDSVLFTNSLKADTARRDFTINAMAYDEEEGIKDFFGGMDDIKARMIRCVGNPTERFTEDALRIIRAVRFASVLDFRIEKQTSDAIKALYGELDLVAMERISTELGKMLCGVNPAHYLREYDYLFFHIIPELEAMKGFMQNNPYHRFDVWNHTLAVLENIEENDLVLRLGALFHDIGKPHVYTEKDGIGHFYGHADMSCKLAEDIMRRLKFSNDRVNEVLTLVKYHDTPIQPTRKFVRKMLGKMPPEVFEKLLSLSRGDILGQSGKNRAERLENIAEARRILEEFDKENECFSLKQLKISGDDLIKMGVRPGKGMGEILNELLLLVVDERLKNDKEVLCEYVKKELLK